MIDELTRSIQDEVPWCMVFANDIADETRCGLHVKLKIWKDALESKGF